LGPWREQDKPSSARKIDFSEPVLNVHMKVGESLEKVWRRYGEGMEKVSSVFVLLPVMKNDSINLSGALFCIRNNR
jgi:hypothetical protein